MYICTGEKCRKRGSKELSKLLRNYADQYGLADIGIIKTHCTDNCKRAPVICLQPENTWHFHVDEDKAMELLKKISE